ncbi:MAG: hypothetical protein QNJ85_17135 [Gammaproteobacteria bacterium]|nr:hypothetical protein [Gammaproteobacteria bacterium]
MLAYLTLRRIVLPCVLFVGALAGPAFAGAHDDNESDLQRERNRAKHEYYTLKHLKLVYSPEVFDYCVDRHRVVGRPLRSCMMKQEKIRTGILDRALRELGRKSLARSLYDDCLDYYPGESISRVGDCVDTRLILRERLNHDDAEVEIFALCDKKWRKHGASAIRNCAISAAGYYRDTGKIVD